ncbi:hypothetical protein IKR55_02905 [bacterium]|jgi:hypothetical protein|nr:hypothetical protein [bacterium]
MSEQNFTFNRPFKPFGMNVRVPERTLQQAGESLEGLVKAPAAPLFEFLEENEGVFNGDVAFEISKTNAQNFNIGSAMRMENEKVNGQTPKFDMHF